MFKNCFWPGVQFDTVSASVDSAENNTALQIKEKNTVFCIFSWIEKGCRYIL